MPKITVGFAAAKRHHPRPVYFNDHRHAALADAAVYAGHFAVYQHCAFYHHYDGDLYTMKPLQYSTFPIILLVATLFRLGLNVSATRLIY